MLASGLALACLGPIAQAAEVDACIERAERIVVARVEALHPQKGTALQIVELVPLVWLFGPEEERLFALPPTTKSRKKANELDVGETYVLFLERWPSPFGKTTRLDVDPRMRAAPFHAWRAFWKVDEERVVVPIGSLPAVGGPAFVPGPKGSVVPRAELIAWLEGRIEASLPTIHVYFGSTGPSGGLQFDIAPDGVIRGTGAAKARLTPEEMEALLASLEAERFASLPERVGASGFVHAPMGKVEARTRAGRKTVSIHGFALDRMTPAERDTAERARRVWLALPIGERTFEELPVPEKER